MANSNNEANIKINGDASGLVRATNIAHGALGKLQTQMSAIESIAAKSFSASGLVGIGLSATTATAALVAAVKSTADYGDALDNMSKRTGESVENLSKLQYAAKMSDVSNEALAKGLKSLAGQIAGAANGAKESGELFEKYGISLRNTDGKVRSTIEVLGDIADVFADMPDGPEKAALAMEFFGSKLGTELIPLMNEGSAGLKALADEAVRLGLVMSGEQAKASAEFNDNLDRLSSLAKGAAVAIGNALIPVLNQYISKLNDANTAQLGFWDRLAIGRQEAALVGKNSPAEMIAKLTKEADDLKKSFEELSKKRQELDENSGIVNVMSGTITDARIESIKEEIAANERRVKYYQEQNKRITGDDTDTATRRLSIASALARELASLEQLRAIAAGKASADILKDDKTRTAEQIKETEKLRDALRSAWETSRTAAQAAADDATKLLAKAAGVRTSARDKATDMRDAGLSEEEKQAANQSRADEALGQGRFYAAAAGAALLDGRAKDFEKYQKQAEQFLERAQKFAEASGDANLVEDVGNQQGALLEQQAKAKQAEAADLQKRAEAQAATLKDIETQLAALEAKATAIEIKFKIDAAIANIAELQGKLDAIKDKTVTVTVNQVGSTEATAAIAADVNTAGLGGFAGGGWTGPGSKYKPAGVVHAEEFVHRREVVRQPGALAFLERFNKIGMNALKGYADGGLVGRLPIPSLATVQPNSDMARESANFYLDGQRFPVQMTSDVLKQLTGHFSREALRKGGRR